MKLILPSDWFVIRVTMTQQSSISNKIIFAADVGKMQYCEVTLTEEKYQAFVYAVKNHYWYQMYIDDLPIWGKILYI